MGIRIDWEHEEIWVEPDSNLIYDYFKVCNLEFPDEVLSRYCLALHLNP